jgi:hypothetical protein
MLIADLAADEGHIARFGLYWLSSKTARPVQQRRYLIVTTGWVPVPTSTVLAKQGQSRPAQNQRR